MALKSPKETTKKVVEKSPKNNTGSVKAAIIGIAMLIAVASIVYSTAVIVLGTQGLTPKILIAPQALLALAILIKQFIKQGDK